MDISDSIKALRRKQPDLFASVILLIPHIFPCLYDTTQKFVCQYVFIVFQ